MSPGVQLFHGPGRTVALPYFVPRSVYTSLRTVQTHLFLCAMYCGVSRRVRTVSFVVNNLSQTVTPLNRSTGSYTRANPACLSRLLLNPKFQTLIRKHKL